MDRQQDIWKGAKELLSEIKLHGFEGYIVGGAVRDYLLNGPVNDIDIATDARPAEIERMYPKTAALGKKHGTILVLHRGLPYEVTTFRGKNDESSTLSADLEKRDFTMNAMALTGDELVIDPFGGKKDLERGLIRGVKDPNARILEDPLRMIRAFRFIAQYDFLIEPQTKNAIRCLAKELDNTAAERIGSEWGKILTGPYSQRALNDFFTCLPLTSLRKDLFPENWEIPDSWEPVVRVEGEVQSWAAFLLIMNEQEPGFRLKKWKRSNSLQKKVKQVMFWSCWRKANEWTNEALYRAGKTAALAAEELYGVFFKKNDAWSKEELHARFDSFPIASREDLSVNGSELAEALERTPGPWISECLKELETAVINSKVRNCKEDLITWIKEQMDP
ncbi:CCA tRNA nucleotidyltransferase [Thalassorhabdus alkalitolerans]|uniref:CCA tRNA nucleotidyltransferase n=1 Tax=Thalassorhabdus alkalitolerans TaxID=2282697 RepID=A0ABW0YP50_9BACI